MRRIVEVDAKTGKTIVKELTLTKEGTKRNVYIRDYKPDSERTFSEKTTMQLDNIATAISNTVPEIAKVESPIKLYASTGHPGMIQMGMPAVFEYAIITLVRGEDTEDAEVSITCKDMAGNDIGTIAKEKLLTTSKDGFIVQSNIIQAIPKYSIIANVESPNDLVVEFEIYFGSINGDSEDETV